MELTLKDLRRHFDGSPGDNMVIELGDETQVIIDTSPEQRDIRISDGEKVIKHQLNAKGEVISSLKNDQHMG